MAQTFPSKLHSRVPDHKSALLGLDMGSNHIRIGTVSSEGEVLAFRREPYSADSRENPRSLADQVASVSRQMIDEHSGSQPVTSIGVAVPGLVNQNSKRIVEISQLPDLSEIDLHLELTQALGVPAHLDTNANAAAFAEMRNGVARGVDDWLYLHIGANVGAGLVLGGVLQRGKSGLAGSIGGMSVYAEHVSSFVPLQSIASADSVVRRTWERLQRDNTSSLSRLGAMGGFSYDDIIAEAHAGDDLARMMLQRTGGFIAMTISEIVSLLNLAMIAIGGAPAGRPILVSAIASELKKRTFGAAFDDCQIVAAEVGPEAAVIGAAMLAAGIAL